MFTPKAIKVIVIDDDTNAQKFRASTLKVDCIGTASSILDAIQTIHNLQPDYILMSPTIAMNLNSNNDTLQAIKVPTNKGGLQIIPLHEIYYLHAEQKYTVIYHKNGQKLLNESLTSLEKKFPNKFIRIHRKTLVAIDKISNLEKSNDGKSYINLINSEQKLLISRRKLPKVRKILAS